jgi:hypothetical protein
MQLPLVPLSLSSLRGGLVATNPNPAEGEELLEEDDGDNKQDNPGLNS